MDKLEPIDSNFWPELRDKFSINWPEFCVPYYTMDTYIRWKKIDIKYKTYEIYSLNGDWNDGTFIVFDALNVFFYTFNGSLDTIERLLLCISPNKTIVLSGTDKNHMPVVYKVIEKMSWKLIFSEAPCNLYRMPKEEAINLHYSIPEGLTVKEVPSEKLQELHEVYSFNQHNTLSQFEKIRDLNLNRGVFDAEGNLLAWCFIYQSGLLNALQTHEHARKRGLAELLTRMMSVELAKLGQDSTAAIVTTNKPSLALFEKIGFKDEGKIYSWLGFTT